MIENAPTIEIWTDGSCANMNNGEFIHKAPGGWGAVLKQGSNLKELFGYANNTTNNRMEMMAVINAVKLLKKPCNITIFSDSRVVVDSATNLFNANKHTIRNIKKGKKSNMDLWHMMIELCKKHCVEFKWVKSHSGIELNELADKLAKQGVEMAIKNKDNDDVITELDEKILLSYMNNSQSMFE